MEPVMKSFVFTVEDLATLIHALVRYYEHTASAIPEAGMLLLSRLTQAHAEMIQDEAEKYLFRGLGR